MSVESEREKIRDPADALSSAAGSPQFADMLDKVLANPSIISAVASALSSGSSAEQKTETSSASPTSEAAETVKRASSAPDAVSTGAVPDGLAEKLPELMSILKPMLTSSSSQKSPSSDRRACLLNAVKPYVNAQRCEAIDYMIKFSRLAEILKSMN